MHPAEHNTNFFLGDFMKQSVQQINFMTGIVCALVLAASATAANPNQAAPTATHTPSTQACRTRVNDTTQKLLACIQQPALWQHLVDFQAISDQNPGPNGHGNRNTGASGYRASVTYVQNLMRQAGYQVAVQTYQLSVLQVTGVPQLSLGGHPYALGQDWSVAQRTGAGTVTASIQAVGGSGTGCLREDYVSFRRGNIAVLQPGSCAYDVQVASAQAAGASAVILRQRAVAGAISANASTASSRGSFRVRLKNPANIPVIAVASSALQDDLTRRMAAGDTSSARLEIQTQLFTFTDYNLIADSPYGDPNHTVVVEGHLDSIFGAGILDNASGSSTILEIALNLARTPTRNHLRYVWFGGEELGLFGSAYYTTHLSPDQLHKIAFDLDADVTATPNYDYAVANPRFASNVKQFPPNVVPESQVGNRMLLDYFHAQGLPAISASFGNDGTDSNSFSLVGIPNTGILTMQDCCKTALEVEAWGGYLGNYEGDIPSFDGGCVDNPGIYCDNLSNNDPAVLEVASKATAYAVFGLANYTFPAIARR